MTDDSKPKPVSSLGQPVSPVTRRRFLQTSALAAGTLAVTNIAQHLPESELPEAQRVVEELRKDGVVPAEYFDGAKWEWGWIEKPSRTPLGLEACAYSVDYVNPSGLNKMLKGQMPGGSKLFHESKDIGPKTHRVLRLNVPSVTLKASMRAPIAHTERMVRGDNILQLTVAGATAAAVESGCMFYTQDMRQPMVIAFEPGLLESQGKPVLPVIYNPHLILDLAGSDLKTVDRGTVLIPFVADAAQRAQTLELRITREQAAALSPQDLGDFVESALRRAVPPGAADEALHCEMRVNIPDIGEMICPARTHYKAAIHRTQEWITRHADALGYKPDDVKAMEEHVTKHESFHPLAADFQNIRNMMRRPKKPNPQTPPGIH